MNNRKLTSYEEQAVERILLEPLREKIEGLKKNFADFIYEEFKKRTPSCINDLLDAGKSNVIRCNDYLCLNSQLGFSVYIYLRDKVVLSIILGFDYTSLPETRQFLSSYEYLYSAKMEAESMIKKLLENMNKVKLKIMFPEVYKKLFKNEKEVSTCDNIEEVRAKLQNLKK